MWLSLYSQLNHSFTTIFYILQTQNNTLTKRLLTRIELQSSSLQSWLFTKVTEPFQFFFFKFLDALKLNSIYLGLKEIGSTMTAIFLYLGRCGACIKEFVIEKIRSILTKRSRKNVNVLRKPYHQLWLIPNFNAGLPEQGAQIHVEDTGKGSGLFLQPHWLRLTP